jgi:hypothetical protein
MFIDATLSDINCVMLLFVTNPPVVMTDGCVHLLEIPSARSWAAPVRAPGTLRQGRRYGPSITVQITHAGSLSPN